MSLEPMILIVDDDAGHLAMLRTMVGGWGYDVTGATDGAEAVEAVRKEHFSAVLMDVRMAGMGGIEALSLIMEYNPALPVLIMTAYSSVDSAVKALKTGAYDYLTKPLDFDVLRLTLERALDHTRLEAENRALREKLSSSFGGVEIIGSSRAMHELSEMVATVAPSDATVLVAGESGTGKELVARAIHAGSSRKDFPLVAVNCAALTETLLESELFGHEKGAFTGADRRREGRFMQADKGTIFLDEIGELSASVQAKLLRVIQEREIQRVGGDKVLGVDVRIIAATNRDLAFEVKEGRFREDLYYRLNVITLSLPSLRDRGDDVALLAEHFLRRFAKRNRKALKGFSPGAMDLLLQYAWPGNVRELENAVERAVILCAGEYVTERELPANITANSQSPDSGGGRKSVSSGDLAGMSLEDIEKRAISATMEACMGNKSEAARKLGVTRATLHNKLKKFGIGS